MKEITYVTSNKGKFEIAKGILSEYGIDVVNASLETPEIQSESVEEVALYSAHYACEKLHKCVFVTDVGYYIEALNGFPGPYVKYINMWLSAEDLIQLMSKKTNRRFIHRGALAYCEPSSNPVCFVHEFKAEIAKKPAGVGTTIDQLMILPGFKTTKGASESKDVDTFWSKNLSYYHEFGRFIKEKKLDC